MKLPCTKYTSAETEPAQPPRGKILRAYPIGRAASCVPKNSQDFGTLFVQQSSLNACGLVAGEKLAPVLPSAVLVFDPVRNVELHLLACHETVHGHTLVPMKNVNRIVAATFGQAKKPRKDKPGQLRPWQVEAFQQLAGKRLALEIVPTGGGKSTSARSLAWHWMSKGYRVLVAAPQDLISRSWCKAARFPLPDGSVMDWPELEKSTLDTKGLVKWADGGRGDQFQVVSHQLLVAAHKAGATFKKVCLVVDEAHRAGAGEDEDTSNRLGSVVAHFCEKKLPLVMVTATFFREDAMGIVPSAYRENVAVYSRAVEDHLKDSGLEVSVEYIAGDTDDVLKAAFQGVNRKNPAIVWIPPAGSALAEQMGGKSGALGAVVEAAPGPVCDLVTVDGREARKEALFDQLDAGKGPTTTVVLGMGFEGYDDPRLTTGVLLGARQSMRATIQALGRLMRAAEGKNRARFVVALPEFGELTAEDTARHLSTVLGAMVIEWYLLPPGSAGVRVKLANPIEAQDVLDDLTREAITGGSVADALAEHFGADAEEGAREVERKISRAAGLLGELAADAPIDVVHERLTNGLVQFSSKVTAGSMAELRKWYRKKIQISEKTRKKAVKWVSEGTSVKKVAKGLNISVSAVRNWCLAEGVPTNTNSVIPSNVDKADVFNRILSGESLNSVAKNIGVHNTTVLAWCRVAGIPCDLNKTKPHDKSKREEACKLVFEGESYASVARKLGVSRQTITAWCKKAGIISLRGA